LLILQPWEAYTSDTSIDLTKHHKPKVLLDKIAYWTVKSLRFPTDIFFQVCASSSQPRWRGQFPTGGVNIVACYGLMGTE
jgi:hypothetical protein